MPSGRAGSPARGPARRRLAEDLARLFSRRRPVMVADFAAQVGYRPSVVRRLLAQAGVRTGGMTCVGMSDAELAPRLSARYRSGVSLGRLSRETGIDRRHLAELIAGQGTTLRPARTESFPADQIPWIAAQYRHGATLRGLAELTGFSFSTIRRELLKAGIPLRTPPGRKRDEATPVVYRKDR